MPRKHTKAKLARKKTRRVKAGPVSRHERFPIAGIGASAGGLEAFSRLLKALPPSTGMAFVLVQHLDPGHESILAKLLSSATAMPVTEVKQGMAVEPDHVYVIPPNTIMGIQDGVLQLTARLAQNVRHMPVDHFLQSLAESQGSRAIGVILSGAAFDGTLGLKAIKTEGGITFAQDEKSAKYPSMPRSAVAAGCVDFVLPPEGIARELVRLSRHPYLATMSRASASDAPLVSDQDLRDVFLLLRNFQGIDFSYYKYPTIKRRIARRLTLHKIANLHQYLKLLREDRGELAALFEDILIHVTSFFREPEVFEELAKSVLPKILRAKRPGEAIRVWVPGCSTGEEVYSLAILLLEYFGKHLPVPRIQLFGTDISDASLERARAGIYSHSSVSAVSEERLQRFFVRLDGGYQIAKSVREMCIFARQDLTKDPPFSRLDLLSCRNVLIYMGLALQKKVLAIFHYALNSGGFLVLGKSESTSGFVDLFVPVGGTHRIYSKKPAATFPVFTLPRALSESVSGAEVRAPDVTAQFDAQKEADRIVLSRYSPAGLIANEDLNILQFRGNVAPFLSPSPGVASLNLLRMVRPEFAPELRTAVQRAKKQDEPIRKEGLVVRRNGHLWRVRVEVVPIKAEQGERYYLVLFNDARMPDPSETQPASSKKNRSKAHEREAERLRRELQSAKEHLQSIIEEQDSTNEELKSANEEILSSNEELQTTNEELETAKEELQSTNEELETVNEQLQNRNLELGQVNDDLANLLSAANIPMVMLSLDLKIRRFTPLAGKLLNLVSTDVGRPIADIRWNLPLQDLALMSSEVIEQAGFAERDIQNVDGHWYSMRLRPYRTLDDKIDGLVMVFVDIDVLKSIQEALREQNVFTAAVMEWAGALVAVTDAEGRIVAFNQACEQTSGYTFPEVKGKSMWDKWLIPKEELGSINSVYRKILSGKSAVQYESHWMCRDRTRRLISWSIAALPGAKSEPRYLVLIGTDITERRQTETALQASETAFRQSGAQLQTLTSGLITAQEEERKRISRDLHDDISQKLTALTVEMEAVMRKQDGAGKSSVTLRALRDRLSEVSEDVRRTAYELHPSSLEHLGLATALRSYCSDFQRHEGIVVRFTPRNVPRHIPSNVSLSMYRMVQEALHNVSKHSGARQAAVSLAGRHGGLTLRVKDSGRGFDPARARGRGLGLISMEERAHLAGGTFDIRARPGEGVRIEVHVPLSSPRKRALKSLRPW